MANQKIPLDYRPDAGCVYNEALAHYFLVLRYPSLKLIIHEPEVIQILKEIGLQLPGNVGIAGILLPPFWSYNTKLVRTFVRTDSKHSLTTKPDLKSSTHSFNLQLPVFIQANI